METTNTKNPKWMTITGWILSLLPCLFMVGVGLLIYFTHPEIIKEDMAKHHIPENVQSIIFIIEMACIAIYLIPQTAVLGAILLTGYLGGAVMVHVQNGEGNFVMAVAFGIIFWLGLYFREPRLRALAPIRKC